LGYDDLYPGGGGWENAKRLEDPRWFQSTKKGGGPKIFGNTSAKLETDRQGKAEGGSQVKAFKVIVFLVSKRRGGGIESSCQAGIDHGLGGRGKGVLSGGKKKNLFILREGRPHK